MATFSGIHSVGELFDSVNERIITPQYILKRIRWNHRIPRLSIESGSASALQTPASATCGAKILLRKARYYMGRLLVCQAGFFAALGCSVTRRPSILNLPLSINATASA